MKEQSLLAFADKFPPYLARICARKGHGQQRLTIREIAIRSGLPKSKVAELAVRTTWRGVDIDVVDRFCAGCGVNLWALKLHRRYLKDRKLTAIMRDSRERRYYGRLFSLIEV